MTPSALRKKLRTLEGRRIDSQYTYACVYCGAQDGVLRQHWCKDELELFCDRCERWTGERISIDDLARWMRSNTVLPVVVALPACTRSQVEAVSRARALQALAPMVSEARAAAFADVSLPAMVRRSELSGSMTARPSNALPVAAGTPNAVRPHHEYSAQEDQDAGAAGQDRRVVSLKAPKAEHGQ